MNTHSLTLYLSLAITYVFLSLYCSCFYYGIMVTGVSSCIKNDNTNHTYTTKVKNTTHTNIISSSYNTMKTCNFRRIKITYLRRSENLFSTEHTHLYTNQHTHTYNITYDIVFFFFCLHSQGDFSVHYTYLITVSLLKYIAAYLT